VTGGPLEELGAARAIVAVFHAGQTALGHRWSVADAAGNELIRTRRTHHGGLVKRALWKSVTLTGLDSGNDLYVDLLDSSDAVVARASSLNQKPPTVTVADPRNRPFGRLRRDGAQLVLESGDSPSTVASITADGDGPWPVTGPGGERYGELLAGDPGPSTSPSWLELLGVEPMSRSSDFARTMHLGIRRVLRYTLLRSESDAPPPAPVIVALLPLLAGLSY